MRVEAAEARRSGRRAASRGRAPAHPPASPRIPAAGGRRARARLPRWLVEGARDPRGDSLAPLPAAAGRGHPRARPGLSPSRGGGEVGRRAPRSSPTERRRRDAGPAAHGSARGKMAPPRTRRRDHTRAPLPSPAFPSGPRGAAEAGGGAGPGLASRRPPDKADNMATSARTSSEASWSGGRRPPPAPRRPAPINFKFPSGAGRRRPRRAGPGKLSAAAAAADSPAGGRPLTFRQVLDALEGDLELERVVERRRVVQHHYIVHLNLCHILKAAQTMGTGLVAARCSPARGRPPRAPTPAPRRPGVVRRRLGKLFFPPLFLFTRERSTALCGFPISLNYSPFCSDN